MLFALFFFFRDGDAIMGRLRRVLPFDPSFREGRIRETAELIKASISSGHHRRARPGSGGRLHFCDARAWRTQSSGASSWRSFPCCRWGRGLCGCRSRCGCCITGEIGRGIALLAIGAGGISLIDNFLRPMLLAGRTQMNGLLVFISLLGGIAAFGLIGLVLGPVIMATAISFVDAYATERRELTVTDDLSTDERSARQGLKSRSSKKSKPTARPRARR